MQEDLQVRLQLLEKNLRLWRSIAKHVPNCSCSCRDTIWTTLGEKPSPAKEKSVDSVWYDFKCWVTWKSKLGCRSSCISLRSMTSQDCGRWRFAIQSKKHIWLSRWISWETKWDKWLGRVISYSVENSRLAGTWSILKIKVWSGFATSSFWGWVNNFRKWARQASLEQAR